MKHVLKPLSFVSVFIAVLAVGIETNAGGLGSIRGVVKDGAGAPLIGADVYVVAEPDKTHPDQSREDRIVKRASTNSEGKFVAAGIAPGSYHIKAEAVGYKPIELAASVRANKATIFDSILLRRTGTLAQETSLNLDPKYASRSARGTIFHYVDDDSPAVTPGVPAAQVSETHGFINSFVQSSSGTGAGGSDTFPATSFALSQQLGRDARLVMVGQTGIGENAPQRLEATASLRAGERHEFSVAMGYGRFVFSRQGAPAQVGQVALAATDKWQISGPVLIVYGLEMTRFSDGSSGMSILPTVGIAVKPAPKTKLFAAFVPGASTDTQSKVNLESGEIDLPEERPVALSPNGAAIADRSFRIQIGGEQALSDNSSLEVMAFFDTISGHGVGLLSVPVDRPDLAPEFLGALQNGQSRGLRIVYKRRLGRKFETSVGYAFGEGQTLDARGISDPASLFSDAPFQVLSARFDANLVNSGTRISAIMRLAPSRAVFAIDPFQGQLTTYDPNLSVCVTQELPSLGILPGQWTAVLDLRNLLDQQGSVADDKQELIASRYGRVVRLGVSVRF